MRHQSYITTQTMIAARSRKKTTAIKTTTVMKGIPVNKLPVSNHHVAADGSIIIIDREPISTNG